MKSAKIRKILNATDKEYLSIIMEILMMSIWQGCQNLILRGYQQDVENVERNQGQIARQGCQKSQPKD